MTSHHFSIDLKPAPAFLPAIALLLLCISPPAWPQDPELQAKENFDEAVKHYKAKQFEAALADFKAAYALTPHWKMLYNIAACCSELGRHLDAARSISQYLKEGQGKLKDKEISFASELLVESKSHVGVVSFSGAVKTATVQVDSETFIGVKAGEELYFTTGRHTLVIKQQETIVLDEEIDLQPNIRRDFVIPASVEIAAPKPGQVKPAPEVGSVEAGPPEAAAAIKPEPVAPSARPMPVMKQAAIGTLTGALVTLVAGAALGGLMLAEQGQMKSDEDEYLKLCNDSDANGQCNGGDPATLSALEKSRNDHRDKVKSYSGGADAMFAIGGALALSSIVLFALSSKAEKKARAGWSVQPVSIGLGSVRLTLSF